MSADVVVVTAVVTHFAHSKASVRLESGQELHGCPLAHRVQGALWEGEYVRIVLSPDATCGRVVERVEKRARPPYVKPKASQRRQRAQKT